MRVTSDFWVSALCRKAAAEGAFAYVAKRGATEAGAIFVLANDMQGSVSLYGPAPQSWFSEDEQKDRLFECVLDGGDQQAATERLEREQRFDPDIWIVEIEDREGRIFVEVVEPDAG